MNNCIDKIKQFLSENWILLIPYIMLFIIVFTMGILNANTLSIRYLANKIDASFVLILVAVGQTFVLLTGGFDLSVGGIICIVNCLAATQMNGSLVSILFWSVAGLILGIAIGMLNGFIIEKTGLQPFIVTLATQSICMGVSLLILKVDGGNVPTDFVNALLTRVAGIPISAFILLALVLWWLYFKHTQICTNIYAIGSNKKSAELNGVPVLKTMVFSYALSGGFAAVAGLFRTVVAASGSPTAGGDYVMISISAAVIGGTALTGGIGGVLGTIIGAFVLRYISDLLVFMYVSSYWSSLVQGVLLILAVALSAYGTIRTKRKEGIS
ncbi:MAG: ABC transporter permease [Spirochaetia bacterium]|jgi:ribose transport system permease protein|nr:ABC transporter permease [Spirochaetia bacterium]